MSLCNININDNTPSSTPASTSSSLSCYFSYMYNVQCAFWVLFQVQKVIELRKIHHAPSINKKIRCMYNVQCAFWVLFQVQKNDRASQNSPRTFSSPASVFASGLSAGPAAPGISWDILIITGCIMTHLYFPSASASALPIVSTPAFS